MTRPLGLFLTISVMAACSSDGKGGVAAPDDPPGQAGPFPRSILVGIVELTTGFTPGSNPAPTPSSNAAIVELLATNISSEDRDFDYQLLGFRLYRDGRQIWVEDPVPPSTDLREVRLPSDRQVTLVRTGIVGDVPLRAGVDEGVYLATVALRIAQGPEIELLVGQVQIAENNGLSIGSDGTRVARVRGRVTTPSGVSVAEARVDVGLRWDDCGRAPFWLEVVSTDSDGFYQADIEFDDRVIHACVTVNVTPIFEFSRFSPTFAIGELDFSGADLTAETTVDVRLTE